MKYILMIVLSLSFHCRLHAQHQNEVKRQRFLVVFDSKSKEVRILPNNRFTSIKSEASKRRIYGPFQADSLYMYTSSDTIFLDSISSIQNIKPLLLLIGSASLIGAIPIALQFVSFATYVDIGIAGQVFFGVIPLIAPLTALSFVYKKEKLSDGSYVYGYQQYPFKHMSGFRK